MTDEGSTDVTEDLPLSSRKVVLGANQFRTDVVLRIGDRIIGAFRPIAFSEYTTDNS